MTDAWSLRGLLGQEGCRDNEMQDVETKAEEGGNSRLYFRPEEEEGEMVSSEVDEEKSFYALLS